MTGPTFDAFFREANGHDAFPWQRRLAEMVLSEGWPADIALPTASGKTACMDIALFALASAGESRAQPRRVFFVVDRRLVVDEAFERAARLAGLLRDARDRTTALGEIAARLKSLSRSDDPVRVAMLRGAVYRDDQWARNPAQPTVVVGTVDQVGSRLLFRGYGVSENAWPLHAGLIGNDALVILDEAHCSRPFGETLGWVHLYRGSDFATSAVPAPFVVVQMTATPRGQQAVFRAGADDLADGVLGPRVRASKPCRLVVSKGDERGLAKTLAQEAASLVASHGVVGVVVNRVATARAVHEALRQPLVAAKGACILLTGRVRPWDRDRLLQEWGARFRAGSRRPADATPLVVVATQCIEVGANLDFDALVSECCALDALRQRFGRLNRLGLRPSAPGVVVVQERQAQESDKDPVYGSALAATWQWLHGLPSADLGVQAMEAALDAVPEGRASLLDRLTRPPATAPVVLPAHCDCWCQTSPTPHADPDPALFLHGAEPRSPDVMLVWRADLDEAQADGWSEAMAACPPTTLEALPAPIHEVRAWLLGTAGTGAADVDAADLSEQDEGAPRLVVPVLRWQGPDSERTLLVDDPADIRPGDTIVLPCNRGGCDAFGWAPGSRGTVEDVADAAQAARRRAILRLHPALSGRWTAMADQDLATSLAAISASVEPPDEGDLRRLLAEASSCEGLAPWSQSICGHLARSRRLQTRRHPMGVGWVVSTPRPMPRTDATDPDFTDEDASSNASSRAVELGAHLQRVADWAQRFCQVLRVPKTLAEDISLAAKGHDSGKADSRFQVWLHGGDVLAAAAADHLLAKSGGAPRTPRFLEQARIAADYPKGARHELVSARLAEAAGLGPAHDQDLVLHLIESHHGRCRPLAPVVAEPRPVEVELLGSDPLVKVSSATGLERLESGVADRYWRLVRRYGWWGLAWLEALVRLADHRASQEEQEEEL